MTKNYPLSDLERFVDNECTPEEAARIQADMAKDPALTEAVEGLEKLNGAVRASAQAVEAPARLRTAVEGRYPTPDTQSTTSQARAQDGPRRALNRRVLLAGAGGAIAAGLATVAILPKLGGGTGNSADPVATFFHDYETFLLKDQVLDVNGTDMVQLAGWFGDRLPFGLPPVSSHEGDVKLVGGRLCWLMGRRLASLSYETANGPVVLYIMNAKGIDAPTGRDKADIGHALSWHRSSGNASLIWSSDQLLYVMVGSQDVHSLMSIAKALTS